MPELHTLLDHGGWPALVATVCIVVLAAVRAFTRQRDQVLAHVQPERVSRPSIRRKIVLVVEDDHRQAELVAGILRGDLEGVDVETTESGEHALQRAREVALDLLIVDAGLIGMQGEELVRRVREEGSKRPLVPVLLLSGQTSEDLRAIARRCGADRWLQKPFDIGDLVEVVRRLLASGDLRE